MFCRSEPCHEKRGGGTFLICNVMKSGGTFFICNESDGTNAADEKWTKKISGMKIYNEKQLRTALEAAGFGNIESHSDAKKHWLCIVAKK